MSKRLQVLLEEAEMAEVRRAARRERMTTAEWVRQALRAARRAVPEGDARKKLAAVRASARPSSHRYVTIDRTDAIQPAHDAVLEIVDEVFAVTLDDALRARDIEVRRIMTFDAAFDDVPGSGRI
jgi:hypothetical protein